MFVGKILDGRWEVKGKTAANRSSYECENIFNHQTIKLSFKQIKDVVDGRTTVSKIMTRRLYRNHYENKNRFCVRNSVVIAYARSVSKYAK